MPHNLFLHSEVIQSRKLNTKNEKVIKITCCLNSLREYFVLQKGLFVAKFMYCSSVKAVILARIRVENPAKFLRNFVSS